VDVGASGAGMLRSSAQMTDAATVSTSNRTLSALSRARNVPFRILERFEDPT